MDFLVTTPPRTDLVAITCSRMLAHLTHTDRPSPLTPSLSPEGRGGRAGDQARIQPMGATP